MENYMEMKFDVCYSLTFSETQSMFEWQRKHNKKFHKKGFGYQGVSPVSNFEVRFGACSIGTWVECVCLRCLENLKDEENPKKIAKIKKSAMFTIRGLE